MRRGLCFRAEGRVFDVPTVYKLKSSVLQVGQHNMFYVIVMCRSLYQINFFNYLLQECEVDSVILPI